ncbi:MAG: NAD(P)-dependent oxidoreductase [Rikenellaceae bacterium]
MVDTTKIEEILHKAYQTTEYPTLIDQCNKWGESRPLKGLTILDATPVFRNTTAKYMALVAAGAEVVVGVSRVMPCDEEVKKLLIESGFRVVDGDDKVAEDLGIDIILDCAAAFIDWPVRLGYVELTLSGIERYRASGKRVYMADSGRIKRIETSLGTGESFFRAMAQLGYEEWSGRKLVLFGSGKVGCGILSYAVRKGAEVWVVSDTESIMPQVVAAAKGVVDYRSREEVDEVCRAAYAVVCATGVVGAVERATDVEALLASEALLANMGVEDEFGATIPADRVLEQKRPINFILEEPTHMKYIDATMALHNAGALHLASASGSQGAIMPSTETEEELLDVSRRDGVIGEELATIL